MKLLTALLFFLAFSAINNCIAQAPAIEWQKCLGGSYKDEARSVQQTIDGGYIVAGFAESDNDGDVSGNHGGKDFWVVKLNAIGNIQWKKCLGGDSNDEAYSIQQTADGGYIVAGSTYSEDGDISGQHGNGGIYSDIWVVKLSAIGAIQWQKCLGGEYDDIGYSIQQTLDGGYIVTGSTESDDGDVVGYHSDSDFWVVKLSATGNLQWQKCLGGDEEDVAYSVQQTTDGGYIVAGYTKSNNGDVSGNHEGTSSSGYNSGDFWVVKLSATGNIQWQKCLGGSDSEEAYSIQQTTDGGYIVAGSATSIDGNVNGVHKDVHDDLYYPDFWVVKLSSNGNLQWQKCLGGSEIDVARSVKQTTDGGYIVTGSAKLFHGYGYDYVSYDFGDISGNHDLDDYWVVKLDCSGNLEWEKSLGGYDYDDAYSVQQTADGGYIVAGSAISNDGDVSGNHGETSHPDYYFDFWVVKLRAPSKIVAELKWDYSFPLRAVVPKGVAADGVSRMYIKVSKAGCSISPAMQNVTLSLSNGANTSTSMLGKVQIATTTSAYSTEANAANSIAQTSNTAQSGDFWFWYVAPDDFTQDSTGDLANASEREVKAHIVATLANGTLDSTDISIKIVRPPLVMVHGLAASSESWNKFNYGNGTLFINSPLFKQKKAVNLLPGGEYKINADLLLSDDPILYWIFGNGSSQSNSLQSNISQLREQGYGCNQVDYVCHSMGGCVLRTAIELYPNKYYGVDGQYKNYGKGFVHKAIFINTPHNNAPPADALTEFIPQLPYFVNRFISDIHTVFPNLGMFGFIEPHVGSSFFLPKWQATPAVKNLQVSAAAGGINLESTIIKNHVIAGDVDIFNPQNPALAAKLDSYLKIISRVFEKVRSITPYPDKAILNSWLSLQEDAKALNFIDWYSAKKGFPNFLTDGDLVVPLSSQLADLPTSSTNVTIFHNNSFLNANHLEITDRTDVGNRIKNLLNSSVNSSFFGTTIPATPYSVGGRIKQPDSFQRTSAIQNDYLDTTKIKIVTPATNNSLPADSIRNIVLSLKDTIDLVYIDLTFQGNTYTSLSRNAIQSFSVKIDSSFIGKVPIMATAIYDRANGTDYYTDTLTVNVFTNAILTGFTAKEETNYIYKNQPFYPVYTASYTNYDAGIPVNSPDLNITVSNSSVVQYNTAQHAFYAVTDTGSATAVINYKGFKDTISFVVLPQLYSGCTNRTTANSTLKSAVNWERGVVPTTCDSVVVMPGHTLVIDSSVQIRCLYISAGATVSLADSTIKLQIGEADDGNKSFINNGSLIINSGKIAVNGSLQLMPGSKFTMTGGQLILDGNTGFNETSLANGANIFDVSNSMNSFSFTGGVLQIIDPPLSNNSQAINCPYNFGDNSTLVFGDGVSATTSNNPNGFGGNLMPAKIGKLIIDAASTTNNRLFINLNPLTVKSAIQVKSGSLVQKALINVIK